MKKTLIYSFCGCFMTSAAVAFSFWVDLGGMDSLCPVGTGICRNNPGNGNCCTGDSIVSQIDAHSDNANKILEGLYIGGTNERGGVKLFNEDGTAVDTRNFTPEQINAIETAANAGGNSAKLVKKQFDVGTVFVTPSSDGDAETPLFNESQTPPRGGTCDYLTIKLYPCTKYKAGHEGQTSDNPSVCSYVDADVKTIYYKTGKGYFSDPDLAENHRYQDATHPNAPNTLAAPTFAGHTFRGWFPTWWASAVTDRSSYIGNVTPYRTVGYAFHIPWKNSDWNDGLYLRAPNWAYSGSNCKLNLFSGWAKNCEDPEYCKIEIAGYAPASESERTRCLDKSCDNICGQWLPGAVEYKLINDCPTGTSMAEGSTSTFTLQYPHDSTNSCTHTLNTYKLSCVSDTPTKIRLQYHASNGLIINDVCTIGDTNNIIIKDELDSGSFGTQTITAVSYTHNGSAVFYADQRVPCQIVTSGTNGFMNGTQEGDYYVVDLYPVSTPTVNIILDLKGGTLSDGEQNITVARGEQLLPGVEPTRGDDAIFLGWYAKNASESTASKNVTIGDDVADGTTYVAKWDCDTANGFDKNLNGVCIQKAIQISEGGETITKPGVYIPKSGGDNNPKESITQEFMSHICKKFKIEFHGCFDAVDSECPTNISNIQNVNGTMWCDFREKSSGHYGCYKDSDYSQKVDYIDVPNAGAYWEFRGYYYGDASTGMIYDWGLTCEYICVYDHDLHPGVQAPSSQDACRDIDGMWYRYCDHVGWHKPCDQAPDDPECVRLATTQQTSKGSPLDGFFPRYSGATTIPVGYGTPMNNIIHVVAPSCNDLTIHLYGAWAHKCEPHEHATCDMTIYRTWDANSMIGNHSKGDVSYTNGCKYGYDPEQNNQYIYNPSCVVPSVESVTVGFKTPTLSDEATCTPALQTFTCTPDDISLIAPDAPNCPTNYRFAAWKTGNGNIYSAGDSIPCASTTLGYNSITEFGAEVSVTGIVCDCSSGTALPRGTGYDGCSTVCAGSTPPNNNFCQRITPDESQHITVMYNGSISGMCYYTVGCAQGYPTMTPNNPTVTCANAQDCTNTIDEYQCTDGGNTGGGSGGNGGGSGGNTPDPCPSVPANWEPDGTLVHVLSGNNDCNYQLTCNKDFYATGGDSNSNIITFGCDGDNCDTQWLMKARNTYHCQIQCPSASDLTVSHGNVTGGTVQGANYQCTYTLGCEKDYTLSITDDGPNPYTCKRGDCQQSTLQSYIDSHYTCNAP